MRFKIPFVLACVGGAVFGRPAHAQPALGADCPVPTFEQCASDSRDPGDPNRGFWASDCGRAEQLRSSQGVGECATYVTADVVEAAASDGRVVFLPPSARKNGNSLAASTTGPYSYDTHFSNGNSGSYAGLLQRGAVLALVQGLDLLSLPDRMAWHGNGLTVASCDEYVYEKYYDYSVFEDSVAVAGDDARAVFDAAYAPDNIGDRARQGLELASKSRNTTHFLEWFGLYPKNVYFEFDGRYPMGQEANGYPMDADIKARIAQAERRPHDFNWHFDMSQALSQHPDDLLYAMEEKQTEFAKLLVLRKTIFEKWQGALKRWAEGVGNCAIVIPPGSFLPDPMIYINPPDFLSLVNLYSVSNPAVDVANPVFTKVIDASNIPEVDVGPVMPGGVNPGLPPGIEVSPLNPDIFVNPGPVIVNPGPVFGPIINGPIINAPILIGGLHANFRRVFAAAPAMSVMSHSGAGAAAGVAHVNLEDFVIEEINAFGDGDCTQMPDLVFDCSSGWSGGLAMVMNYGERVTRCLKVVDEKIEVSLKEAREDGCLDPQSPTPCDWSPRMFVRELKGRVLDGKENSYQACTRFTGGDFGPLALIKTAQSAGISAQNDMTLSSEHVDKFFKDIKAWAQKQVFPEDPTTGKPIFGAKTADSSDIGNKDFGVAYKYDVGWKLSNLDATNVRICSAEVDLNADFDVEAMIFGHAENLVSSHSYLRTDEVPQGKQVSYQASLVILGSELLGQPKKNSTIIPGTGGEVSFPLLSEKLVERRTLMEAKAHFAIGPIPVTISAGAAGEVGVELSLDGQMGYRCPRPHENPNGDSAFGELPDVLSVGARGGARPYAALNAFATAAVDIVVASAGVRADLTLLSLSVPFTVGVSANISPGSTPSVTAKTDMKLVVETLSGRISVFVDTLFGKVFDQTIFTWSGPKVEKTIVDDRWDMDLRAARFAVIF